MYMYQQIYILLWYKKFTIIIMINTLKTILIITNIIIEIWWRLIKTFDINIYCTCIDNYYFYSYVFFKLITLTDQKLNYIIYTACSRICTCLVSKWLNSLSIIIYNITGTGILHVSKILIIITLSNCQVHNYKCTVDLTKLVSCTCGIYMYLYRHHINNIQLLL